ncbi:serine protein kinase [Boeremia exigua]|uniref:serine protein kinase n=1 Tax=Boeremia exigua TaxID=749465 RepID=UPI001E8E35A0|nr:serine protein kinase [Boeremia exigua]KAH6612603.1 serine protein kinase [Boeremia exigua]
MAFPGFNACLSTISRWRATRLSVVSSPCRRSSHTPTMRSRFFEHDCDVPAEPLHRYQTGGYHPVHLGDFLHDGRYKILHKLGWGGYSTVWAARDQKTNTYVAVKILVAEQRCQNRELATLRTLKEVQSDQPGYQNVMTMQDFFQVQGPNGTHDCLVLEMLGPNLGDFIGAYVDEHRYPGKVVKSVVAETLLGLHHLHEQGIVHGDLHTRNVAFTIPSVQELREQEFLQKLGDPNTSPIRRVDGAPLEPSMPQYLVMPTDYPHDCESAFGPVKIIDFGQCFSSNDIPLELHTPISVRPPEVVFKDKVDYRMDLWSMGCMLFELVTKQLPFDALMQTPSGLVAQMLERTDEALPRRWQEIWRPMSLENQARRDKLRAKYSLPLEAGRQYGLQEWLHKMYFETEQRVDLSQEDMFKVGALIHRMLRLEPAARPSARELLQDSWFLET